MRLSANQAEKRGPHGLTVRLLSGRPASSNLAWGTTSTAGQAAFTASPCDRAVSRKSAITSALFLANWLLVLGFALALWVLASTNTAPVGGFVGSRVTEYDSILPAWEPAYADQFPGCHEPVEGEVAARVLVVNLDGSVTVETLDTLMAGRAPMWKVGHCS